ncbi:MAG: P1 family peptidase [Chloroflexota bacterium]
MPKLTNSITDVPGIKVGHAQDLDAITGCTVILAEDGVIAGVDQRGGGPATRETDALNPINLINQVHAVMLSGGSAFGLDASSGVMQYLKERKIGYNTGIAKIPIVPAASLFDLGIGDPNIYPDFEMGYQASKNASENNDIQGNVGAGTGATTGKLLGPRQATKSGIGTAILEIGGGVIVGALVAANPLGDIIHPETNTILAGTRSIQKGPLKIGGDKIFADSLELMKGLVGKTIMGLASRSNTVIGVVATNAKLTKPQATQMAQMAQNGVVRTVRPANTLLDGDTIFVMATGSKKADVNILGAFAAQLISNAILNAVMSAISIGGIPSLNDLQ